MRRKGERDESGMSTNVCSSFSLSLSLSPSRHSRLGTFVLVATRFTRAAAALCLSLCAHCDRNRRALPYSAPPRRAGLADMGHPVARVGSGSFSELFKLRSTRIVSPRLFSATAPTTPWALALAAFSACTVPIFLPPSPSVPFLLLRFALATTNAMRGKPSTPGYTVNTVAIIIWYVFCFLFLTSNRGKALCSAYAKMRFGLI